MIIDYSTCLIMKLTIEFLFLIGTAFQIVQSEEITVDTQNLGANTQSTLGTTVDQVWNNAYSSTTSGLNWFRNYLYHIPDDLTTVSTKAKDYIYSIAASSKNYANDAGVAMMNYADDAGAKINGLRQSTSVTVNDGETKVNTEIKQTQVYTTDTVNTN